MKSPREAQRTALAIGLAGLMLLAGCDDRSQAQAGSATGKAAPAPAPAAQSAGVADSTPEPVPAAADKPVATLGNVS
ncbi:MAG TPA: hypothetical protein VEA17_23015, partial [Bordetella sp.]|nr:hypothetical protein [Bordetella sp.]